MIDKRATPCIIRDMDHLKYHNDTQAMRLSYESGETLEVIGQRHELSKQAVANRLRKAGVKIRDRGRGPSRAAQ